MHTFPFPAVGSKAYVMDSYNRSNRQPPTGRPSRADRPTLLRCSIRSSLRSTSTRQSPCLPPLCTRTPRLDIILITPKPSSTRLSGREMPSQSSIPAQACGSRAHRQTCLPEPCDRTIGDGNKAWGECETLKLLCH